MSDPRSFEDCPNFVRLVVERGEIDHGSIRDGINNEVLRESQGPLSAMVVETRTAFFPVCYDNGQA